MRLALIAATVAATFILAGAGQAQTPAKHSNSPTLAAPKQAVILTVSGNVALRNGEEGALFDAAMIDALPMHSFRTATPWFKEAVTFRGPLLQDVLDAAGATGQALRLLALNDYAVTIPMDDVRKYAPLLARSIDGKQLGVRDKGPLFLIYPFDAQPDTRNDVYYSRSIWQLVRITVQ